jgi:hypothetical protein
MRNGILATLLLVFVLGSANAQKLDIGIQIGIGVFDGDLSLPSYTANFKQGKTSVGLIVRYEFLPGSFVRGGILKTQLESYDSRSTAQWRINRDLQFQTDIVEGNVIFEFHPFQWMPAFDLRNFSPYGFFGLGYFTFNPQAEYNGELVDLQPLGTEGQGMPGFGNKYELNSLAIPFGLGLSFSYKALVIDLEYGVRLANTDYLDDVSGTYVDHEELTNGNGIIAADLGNKINAHTGAKRGNQGVNDWYTILGLTLSYRFDSDNHPYIRGRKRGKELGCPKF